MLEFLRILGIVLACTGFVLSVFVFIRYRVPEAVRYFTGSESKRLKEYQKQQREYIRATRTSSVLRSGFIKTDDATATMAGGDETVTISEEDSSFATALLYAESTTTLLDGSDDSTEPL